MSTPKTATARSGWAHVTPLYCACGAQWHGRYAVPELNPVINAHATRRGCGFLTEAEYHKRFPVRQYRKKLA